MDQVRGVPLTGVDPKSIREETRRDLDLAVVYTALMTQRTDIREERTLRPEREHRACQPWPCSTWSPIWRCSATQAVAKVPLSTLWRCAWLGDCAQPS